MDLTTRELWTALHGLLFGAGFLLAFAGGVAGLWGLRPEWTTVAGRQAAARRLMIGTWTMAALAWATVVIGTYLLYPWYRAQPAANAAALPLANFPRALLLSSARTAGWHQLGMEWKEHVAWLAPILATAVAFVVTRQRRELALDATLRRVLLFLFIVSFLCAGVAGFFGAFLNKAAPIR